MKVIARRFRDLVREWVWNHRLRRALRQEREGDAYERYVRATHRLLCVPQDYPGRLRLPFQRESSNLVALPCGLWGELRQLDASIVARLDAMRRDAARDGVSLIVRWGYRSASDQTEMIRRQLRFGAPMSEILTRVAAPGYSEHHTGRAIDFERIPGDRPFELTEAYRWLRENGSRFDCFMSYPEGNAAGVIYEPWHWYLR